MESNNLKNTIKKVSQISENKHNNIFEELCNRYEKKYKSIAGYTGGEKANMKLIKTLIILMLPLTIAIIAIISSIIMILFSENELWSKMLLYGTCSYISLIAISLRIRMMIIESFEQ
jgi:hypothetical protein